MGGEKDAGLFLLTSTARQRLLWVPVSILSSRFGDHNAPVFLNVRPGGVVLRLPFRLSFARETLIAFNRQWVDVPMSPHRRLRRNGLYRSTACWQHRLTLHENRYAKAGDS